MPAYDPNVIVQFADQLYRRAQMIVLTYSFIGTALAGLGVTGAAVVVRMFSPFAFGFMGAAIGAGVGMVFGQDKAFSLRLQAQQALCQVQIEANTRRGGSVSVGPPMLEEEPRAKVR